MNAIIILISILFIYATTTSQTKLSLESLCVIDQDQCVVNKEKQDQKKIENIQGFYCLSEKDLRKIVSKLQSQ